MAKRSVPKKQKSFEQTLWDTADKLRGTVESSEYKHVVLVKISSIFTARNVKPKQLRQLF